MANGNVFTRPSSQEAKMQNDINSCKILLLIDSNSQSRASKAMAYTRKQATF